MCKAFKSKKPKYDGYQRVLVSMVDKWTSDGKVKNEIICNKKVAEEIHKPTITKFEKRRVHSPFIDNMQICNW